MVKWLLVLGACSTDEGTPPLECVQTGETWENFAHGYVETWCSSCHSEELVGEFARYQAPPTVNFDRLELVRQWQAQLVYWAGGDDPLMPPAGGVPQAQVDRFTNWVVCGLPGDGTVAVPDCADAVPVAGDQTISTGGEADALCAAGPVDIDGSLTVGGDADLGCVCSVGGALTVSAGDVDLSELVSVGGALSVTGAAVALRAPELKSLGGSLTAQDVPDLEILDVSEIRSVGGDLSVTDAPALAELLVPFLTAVPGDLRIERSGAKALDLTRLESTNGDIVVADLDDLVELRGNTGALVTIGGSLRFRNLPAWNEAYGFAKLQSVAGDLEVVNCDSTETWVGFTELVSIGGSLLLLDNDGLTQYDAFDTLSTVGGDLEIVGNDGLFAVDRFEELATVGGALRVEDNPNLVTIGGLVNVEEVGSLTVADVEPLTTFPPFAFLTAVHGDLRFANIAALAGIVMPGQLEVVEGSLVLEDLPLASSILFGGNDLDAIGGDLRVSRTGLLALDLPSTLVDIGGSLVVEDNVALTDVTALAGLDQVAGDLVVTGNTSLPSASANGLIGEFTVGGAVQISGNGP